MKWLNKWEMPKSYWIGYFRTDRVSGLGCQKKTDSGRNSEKAARIETEVKILYNIYLCCIFPKNTDRFSKFSVISKKVKYSSLYFS